MKITKIYCDHCKKEVTDEYYTTDIPIKNFRVELCSDCENELETLIMDFISKGNGDNNV